MAVVNPPVWLEAGTYTAGMDRLVTGLLVDRNYDVNGNLQSIEGGVVGPKNQLIVTGSGTMTLAVSAGVAVVPRATLEPPGVYLCYNNAATSVTVPIAATNQRNDILCARVNDSEEGNVGDNWEFFLVAGAALASPVDPTVPANYVKLARINVKAAALNGGVDKITSAQVTDLRTFVSGMGGVHISWNGNMPQSQPGRLVYDMASNPNALKYGVGGSTWWTLVPDELRAFRALAFGTRSDYHDSTCQKTGGASGNWDQTPPDSSSGSPISAVNVNAGGYYTTAFKVTIAALGKCDDVDISGHLSVQVRDGTTEIYPPAIGKGPSFYGTFWVSSENSFIVSLPPNYLKQSVNFRVMFRSNYTGSGGGSGDLVKFQRIRLIVEPTVV